MATMPRSASPRRRMSLSTAPSRLILLIAALLLLSSSQNAAVSAIDLFKSKTSGNSVPTALEDASTGTVTAVDPSQDNRAASTCDGIMAKAVVLANEEKATATTERDEATAAAEALTQRVSDLEGQVRELTETSEKAKAEAKKAVEAQKAAVEVSMTEANIVVERALKEADVTMENVRREAQDEIDAVKADAGRAAADAQDIMEQFKKDAQDEVEAAKKAAAERAVAAEALLEEVEKEAEEAAEAAKAEAQRIQSYATSLAEKTKQEARDEIAATKAEAKSAAEREAEAAAALVKASVSAVREKYDAEIESLEVQLSESKEEVESLIAEVESEKEKGKTEVQATLADLGGKIEKLQREKEEELAKRDAGHKELVGQLVKETGESTRNLDAKLTGEKQGVERKLKNKEDEYDKLADEYSREKSQSSEKIQRFERREGKFKNLVENLKKNITALDDEKQQTYCNMTNIQRDSATAVKLMGESIYDIGNFAYQTAAKLIAAPIAEKTTALYDKHLREAVDANITPVYKEKVAPVYKEHVLPAKEKASIILKDGLAFAALNVERGWKLSVAFTKESAARAHGYIVKGFKSALVTALDLLEKHDGDKIIPDGFRENMKVMRDNADEIVTLQLKTITALLVFINLPVIFDVFFFILDALLIFLWEAVCLPFRVFWYFCPLKFLFRKKVAAVDDEEEVKDSKDMADKGKAAGDKQEEAEAPAPELVEEKAANGTNGTKRGKKKAAS